MPFEIPDVSLLPLDGVAVNRSHGGDSSASRRFVR
jgi:hypothetical protein